MLQENPLRERVKVRSGSRRPFAIRLTLVLLGLLAMLSLAACAVGVMTEGNLIPLVLVVPAVCLFLVAMGISKYRGWARGVILLIAGALPAFCPIAIAIDAVVLGKQLYLGLPTVYLVTYAAANVIYIFLAALGIWWLVYFNRRSTKALFGKSPL